jgi:hypothetical protein
MTDEKKGFEKIEPPQFETEPDKFKCDTCDQAAVIGLLTGTCQLEEDEKERENCWEAVKPVGEGKKKPEDALVEYLKGHDEEGMNKILDRINWLIYKATLRAKEELIKEGKLNPDGTPKEVPVK